MDNERRQPRKWDDDFEREFFTPEEIAESDARVELAQKNMKTEAAENGRKEDTLPEPGRLRRPDRA